MNIASAACLLAVCLGLAWLAPVAVADELGYPPAPPPLPVDDATPAAAAESLALPSDVVYEVERAPVRDEVVLLEDVTPAADVAAVTLERSACGACRPCCRPCEDPCCRKRGWDVTAEASLSWFEDPTGILGLTPPAGTNSFAWGANTLDPALGGRLTVGYRSSWRDRFEARASGTVEESASSVQAGRRFGFSATPGAATMLSPPATATLVSRAQLWSGELNWWRQLTCNRRWRLEGIAGVRYLRYQEEAEARNWIGLAATSFLRNRATSRFIGAQAGAAFTLHAWRRVEVGVIVKGLLGHMQNRIEETDTAIVTGGATTDATRDDANFGYGVEAEIAALLRLSRRVGLTAAYTLLFLGNTARAPNTLDFSQAMTGSLQTRAATESNIIHSVFVGVRVDV